MRAFLRGFGEHMRPDNPAQTRQEAPGVTDGPAEEPPIKEPPMEIDGRCMSPVEFVRYVTTLDMPDPLPTRVFLHHTWRPTPETWQGRSTMYAMKAYYEKQIWEDAQGRKHEGWNAGPHLFVAQDGIWLFSDLCYDGVGVYGHNYRTRHIEIVGDYDNQQPSGAILENTIVTLGILHERFGLDIRQLGFHRDFSTKSCPGWAIEKSWIIPLAEAWIAAYRRVNGEAFSALRRSLLRMIQDQLVIANPSAALAKEAERRGYLGALSHEIPMEIDDQAFVVQLFADALLVPVPKWDNVHSLREYEEGQAGLLPSDKAGQQQAPPPSDPYNYQP